MKRLVLAVVLVLLVARAARAELPPAPEPRQTPDFEPVPPPAPLEGRGALRGKSFVLTGTLESMSREAAEQKILAAGGRVTSAISRKTDYLVAGADPGSKLRKAADLGVKTLDEHEFVALIEG